MATRKAKEEFIKSTEAEMLQIFNGANDFKNEKEMCDYIELNIKEFCMELFGDDYICHKREYGFVNTGKRMGCGVPKGESNTRIDFVVRCTNNTYFVEVKNPIQIQTELTRAIGQLTLYQYHADIKSAGSPLVLVSSKYNDLFYKLLKKHNVRCKYMLFNKYASAYIGEVKEANYA